MRVEIPWSENQWNEVVDGHLYGHGFSIPCIGEDRYIAEQMLKLGHTKYKYVGYDDTWDKWVHFLDVQT